MPRGQAQDKPNRKHPSLQVTTGGELRVWSRDDVRNFVAQPAAEGLIAEFVQAIGRTIDVLDSHGVAATVQVRCTIAG